MYSATNYMAVFEDRLLQNFPADYFSPLMSQIFLLIKKK